MVDRYNLRRDAMYVLIDGKSLVFIPNRQLTVTYMVSVSWRLV